MAETFFQDFLRDDGSPVTVEYSFHNLGGSGCEVDLVDVMPNTPEYGALCARVLAACREADEYGIKVPGVDEQITAAKNAIDLTANECDRMVAWLAEHHDDAGGRS